MSGPPTQTFRVEHAALSDLGMRRLNNQDAVTAIVAPPGSRSPRGDLMLVADGMGAHAAGELASKLAVDCIPHTYLKLSELPPQAALRQAVHKANSLINAKGQSSPEFQGMGTTCSCLLLLGDAALVAHVGDSRVYRLREGKLEQLTFDHSLVWEMAAASHTTAEEVPDCIPKNVITRSLGPHNQVNVDLEGPHTLCDGDVFLVCSDGLTGVVEDELIGAILGAMPPEEAGQTLIDLANLRGGPDNISTVIARVAADDKKKVAPATPSAPKPDELAKSPSAPSLGRVRRGVWLAIAASLLAFVWFASQSNPLGAAVASACFGASIVVAMMQRKDPADSPAPAALGGPYGNGPYRSINCLPGEPAARAIGEVVDQLAELEHREPSQAGPPLEDWKSFHEERHRAKHAEGAGDHAQAVAHFGAAIRGLMEQVRASRTTVFPAKDSAV